MAKEFIVPGRILTGTGALDLAVERLGQMGSKALIVTDEMMIKLGNCEKVEAALKKAGVSYSIFSGITGEPTDKMVEEGLAIYRKESCDFLVALGGGSPMDTMKAIGAVSIGNTKITDYLGKVIDVKMPPMAAIPTTAGTGSEATQFTIITDTERDIKMLLKGACLMPDLAIIDP
ncbi:MAG: iron-containing alcohol dehydrogenase, partial [Lachnospiraceae bacterium]|nr:iron-containing alcohol dehydrogenase [Lachnospiraceae bacterium]